MLYAAMVRALALVALLGLALPVQAAPAPIVFDFEDGLQGWEFSGSAQRVQTQLLDGEWAIFGDGLFRFLLPPDVGTFGDPGTYIALEIDVTQIASMTLDFFFAGAAQGPGEFISAGEILGKNIIAIAPFPRIESTGPVINPRALVWDLSGFDDVIEVAVLWTAFNRDELPRDARLGFIDNITFHPVPEPSTLALAGVGLALLVIIRRGIM